MTAISELLNKNKHNKIFKTAGRIAEKMESAAKPLWEGQTKVNGPPAIERFFFVAFSGWIPV